MAQLQETHLASAGGTGLGRNCAAAGLPQDLSEEELTRLREEVDNYTVEGDLRRFNALNIKRLKEINCYRGRRHYNVSGRMAASLGWGLQAPLWLYSFLCACWLLAGW